MPKPEMPVEVLLGGSAISTSNPLPVASHSNNIRTSVATFTRPNTTSPTYTIGDVIGTSPASYLTFPNVVDVAGASGRAGPLPIRRSSTTTSRSLS